MTSGTTVTPNDRATNRRRRPRATAWLIAIALIAKSTPLATARPR